MCSSLDLVPNILHQFVVAELDQLKRNRTITLSGSGGSRFSSVAGSIGNPDISINSRKIRNSLAAFWVAEVLGKGLSWKPSTY